MDLHIILLSAQPERVEMVRRTFAHRRVFIHEAASIEDCRRLLQPGREHILFFDQTRSSLSWREPLQLAEKFSLPVIVILHRFDSQHWIEILKAGACDVLADPVTPERLYLAAVTAVPDWVLVRNNTTQSGWLANLLVAGRRLLHL